MMIAIQTLGLINFNTMFEGTSKNLSIHIRISLLVNNSVLDTDPLLTKNIVTAILY